MVQVIQTLVTDHTNYGGGCPLIHIYGIERHVHGNGVYITVYGEIKIAAGEQVWAHELKLNSIEVLTLTPELLIPDGHGYMAQKYIYQKGAYNNYASVDIYNDAGTWQGAGTGRVDGSIWLDFVGKGEA
jgi:hypothetical protein